MMSCVLRAGGPDFNVDAFLDESPFEPCAVWHRGESRFRSQPPSVDSGFNLDVGEGELREQIAGAIQFLIVHEAEIRRLSGCTGIEIILDFAIARRNVIVQSDSFPATLIHLAGSLKLGIELTQYPVENSK